MTNVFCLVEHFMITVGVSLLTHPSTINFLASTPLSSFSRDLTREREREIPYFVGFFSRKAHPCY